MVKKKGISQDIYLLNDTVKNNIIFGSKNFDIKEFNEAVVNSQFKDVINTLNNKGIQLLGKWKEPFWWSGKKTTKSIISKSRIINT